MAYILDTCSFRVLSNYYPNQFPSFWTQFDQKIALGEIISVREVRKELDYQVNDGHLRGWLDNNRQIFLLPTEEETQIVAQILSVPHFQHLISQRRILTGGPVADPFIIAAAMARGATVVTQERKKENAAKIPNVCDHFSIECIDFRGVMERENWQF